jgi:hypothetical protein
VPEAGFVDGARARHSASYPGALEVIRWYQLQESTFVGRRRSSGGVLRVTGVLATVLCLTFDGAPNPG